MRPGTNDGRSGDATAGDVLVEIAVDSVAGAEAAAAAGADRIELCADLAAGGLTPSLGLLDAVRAAVQVPVFVMIRPRPGDFLFDPGEVAVMRRDAAHLRAAGAAGVVTGALRADGAIDRDTMHELIAAAAGLPVTCHRAFDVCADAMAAIDALLALGVARVLTSGQAANALAGAGVIRACVQRTVQFAGQFAGQLAGQRLVVMAGGGVRDGNVLDIVAATGVREVHLSAAATRASAMQFRRGGVRIDGARDGEHVRRFTDGAVVARVVQALRGAERRRGNIPPA